MTGVRGGLGRPLWVKAAVRARMVMRVRVVARRILGMVVAPWGVGWGIG